MLHSWRVIVRSIMYDQPMTWECAHCHARVHGPNDPRPDGCPGHPPQDHRPNMTMTRDNF